MMADEYDRSYLGQMLLAAKVIRDGVLGKDIGEYTVNLTKEETTEFATSLFKFTNTLLSVVAEADKTTPLETMDVFIAQLEQVYWNEQEN